MREPGIGTPGRGCCWLCPGAEEWARVLAPGSGGGGDVRDGSHHGDTILHGEVTPGRLVKMGLTTVVPYLVSTLTIVGVILSLGRGEEAR